MFHRCISLLLLGISLFASTALAVAAPAPIIVDLFSSVAEARPGQLVSLTATLKAGDAAPIPARLTITFNAAGSVLNVTSNDGNCTTTAQSATCTVTVDAPGAAVTVQAQVRSDTTLPVLRVDAALRLDDGTTLDAAPVLVRVAGPALASATPTPSLSPSPIAASPVPSPSPTASAAPVTVGLSPPTATGTPLLSERPDTCEPDDQEAQACVLTLDAVNGPYTIVPENDRDEYSVDLGTDGTAPTTVFVRATDGLDLRTTIRRADTGVTIATIASPAISTTIPIDVTGWVRLRVENSAPELAAGETYRIELRRSASLPPPPPSPVLATTLPPDALENNWSPATAAPIAVGYAYDLNFSCPVPGGCPGGDHDYVRFTVKRGIPYLLATFDLGPGVDTVLDLYWGSETASVASNDDARPGYSGLSALRWTAPSDGEAVVRIAPRTGALRAIVPEEDASAYRFAVAMTTSPFGRELADRIAEQTGRVTPTPSARPAPAAPASGTGSPQSPTSPPNPAPASPFIQPTTLITPTNAVQQNVAKGVALVVITTTLYLRPDATSPVVAVLAPDALVTLQGDSSGLWVRVTTATDVLPGWVLATQLRRVSALVPTPPAPPMAATTTGTLSALGGGAGAAPTASPATAGVRILDPLPEPTAPPAPARISRSVTVLLVAAQGAQPTPHPGARTPTPSGDERPLAGLRVQLVSALGEVLAEGITPASGRVTLTRDVVPSTALLVQLPQLGLSVPVPTPASDEAVGAPVTLSIAVPAGGPR